MKTKSLTRKAGRPRSVISHQAILKAALDLFAQEGLARMSVEAIAQQAGVGKTTIYRRWRSKEDVIKEALTLFREDQPLPDTGRLREDLLSIAHQAQVVFRRDPQLAKLTAKLIAEAKAKPDLYRAFYDKVVAPRREQFREMVQRAQARGEIRPELDAAYIVSLIFITLVYGPFFGELIDPDAGDSIGVETAVDALLGGIGAHRPQENSK